MRGPAHPVRAALGVGTCEPGCLTRPGSDLMRRQFEFAWSLAEFHLDRLVAEDSLWEPAPLTWTVRQGRDGYWIPDWADQEPDAASVPTTCWVTWHIGWWSGVALDHAQGRPPREREAVIWPGPAAAVGWLRARCVGSCRDRGGRRPVREVRSADEALARHGRGRPGRRGSGGHRAGERPGAPSSPARKACHVPRRRHGARTSTTERMNP